VAPNIPEVDADRHGNLGLSAWGFRDEVLRWLLHGKQSPPCEDLLIPFLVIDQWGSRSIPCGSREKDIPQPAHNWVLAERPKTEEWSALLDDFRTLAAIVLADDTSLRQFGEGQNSGAGPILCF
jgi:hypothetical protein